MIAAAVAIRFGPIVCIGTRQNGDPCRKLLCFGVLKEVPQAQSVVSTKCQRCGRIAFLG